MGIQINWYDDTHSIVHMCFEPDWLVEDLHTAVAETDRLIASVPHRVDLIIDLQNGMKIPKDFMSIAQQLLANPEPRPNEGTKVVVGASTPIRLAYSAIRRALASKLDGREIHFESNLPQAQNRIAALRQNSS